MMARLSALVLALVGCASQSTDLGSSEGALISDAVHNGGREGFYFLPPMVAATPLPPAFDNSLAIEAKLVGDGHSHSFPLVATDTSYSGTLDTGSLELVVGATYRLHVTTGGFELGFADVNIYASHARSVATDEYFELVDGKKLRIKVYVNRCAAVTCSATACRIAGTCDPLSGSCSTGDAVPDGTTCNDANICNGDEACVAGECTSTAPDLARWDCARWDQATYGP